MEVLIQLTVLGVIFLGNSFTTGEAVVTVKDKAPCLNGKSHTLTCDVKKRKHIVEWMNENDDIPIVHCDRKSCSLNAEYQEQYNYTYNLAKNIFNLTILKVNKKYDGKKLVCSVGRHFGCTVLYVGEYGQRLEETEKGILTATSACTSPRRIVSFKWIKIDASSNKEEECKPKILYTNVTHCSNDECGRNYMKYTEAISAASGGNGTKYYLKMEVFYGKESIVSRQTTVAYMIDEQAEEFESSQVKHVLVPVVIVVFIAAAAVVVAIIFGRKKVIRLIRTYTKRDKNLQGKNKERKPFINSGKKKNEEGSADQEKVKGPLETRKYYKDSDVECTDPNSNDNHGNDSVDMKGNCGVVYDKETLPKYLLEEDDEYDDDDGIKDKKINEEGSADQEKVKGPLETRKYYKDSDVECTDPNSNDNHGNDSVDMKGNCGVVYDKETLPKLYLLEEDDEDDDGFKDLETLDGIFEDNNAPENTVDEVTRASHQAKEATAAAAGIKSRDEQINSLPSLSKFFGKDTCAQDHFAAQIFGETSASVASNKRSDKAIPSCIIHHGLSTESSLPKPNISMTFLTRRSTEEESKGSGSLTKN